MFSKIICLYLVTLSVFAAPPVDKVPLEKQQPTVIPIISQSEELESNGTYKFSYETANGITREEISYDKVLPKSKSASSKEGKEDESDESNEIHVQRGSYSYTAPDGSVISVRYIADENGFRPIGDHFPKSPSIAAARSAGKKGRKADLDHEESKSALRQANNGPKPSAPQPQQGAALESDSEPLEPKFGEPKAASSASPESPSEPAALESSTTEGSGSETLTSEAFTAEASETSTPVESSSGASTTEATSEASDASTMGVATTEASATESSEASTPEGSTTVALTSETSTSDTSTLDPSTPEVSSTPESSTTELTSTAADQTTTESSTTTAAESSSAVTSDYFTTLAGSETTTLAST